MVLRKQDLYRDYPPEQRYHKKERRHGCHDFYCQKKQRHFSRIGQKDIGIRRDQKQRHVRFDISTFSSKAHFRVGRKTELGKHLRKTGNECFTEQDKFRFSSPQQFFVSRKELRNYRFQIIRKFNDRSDCQQAVRKPSGIFKCLSQTCRKPVSRQFGPPVLQHRTVCRYRI